MVGSPPPGRYPTKRDRRRQCNPACKPSSSDARFALDPEREGRRYTSPLKNIPAVPAGRALRGGTRVRGLEGLVDHRYESKMTGTDYQGRPRGLARGNAALGLIESGNAPLQCAVQIHSTTRGIEPRPTATQIEAISKKRRFENPEKFFSDPSRKSLKKETDQICRL